MLLKCFVNKRLLIIANKNVTMIFNIVAFFVYRAPNESHLDTGGGIIIVAKEGVFVSQAGGSVMADCGRHAFTISSMSS